MSDLRKLCAELLLFAEQAGEICEHEGLWPKCDQQPRCVDGQSLWLLDRARLALAEREPEVPTDEELLQVFDTACLSEGGMVDEIHLRGLRAVLARWGRRQ